MESLKAVSQSLGNERVSVRLFGSQARNEARPDSDWDILVTIDKHHLDEADREHYACPFWQLGWQMGAMIHPIVYTLTDWQRRKGTPFYDNVESEAITLC